MTREEAINKLNWALDNNTIEDVQSAYDYIMAIKMAIKALEQEPKMGHWIRWYEQKEYDWCIDNIPHCKCSECGKEYDPHSSQFIKYCCECGVKMTESEDKE